MNFQIYLGVLYNKQKKEKQNEKRKNKEENFLGGNALSQKGSAPGGKRVSQGGKLLEQ